MRRLFEPRSLAIVGASPSERGRGALDSVSVLGFEGRAAAVNPRYDEVLEYPCAPTIQDLPFVPDAVLVSVNRDLVPGVIEDAVAAGVGGAVVVAIGFAEAGEDGRRLQERLVDVSRAGGLAVIGPNCQGMINFVTRTPLYLGQVAEYEPGRVALLSQSGSVTTTLANNNRGVRWSHVVSCGNEAVVDSADLLSYLLDQPAVHAVCGYLETIRDPERFFAECDRARDLGKPIVLLKSGRTEASQAAATAHSGALAAPDRLVDVMLRRHGVLRVSSLEELLETAIAVQSSRRPKRGSLASLTASGGQIELLLDESAHTRLRHQPFAEETRREVKDLLPAFLDATNPLDYWGMKDIPNNYPGLVSTVSGDDEVEVVTLVGDFSYHPTARRNRASLQKDTAIALSESTDKLFVVLDTVDGNIPAAEVEAALDKGVLLLSGLREGLRAIEHLTTLSEPRQPRTEHAAYDAGRVTEMLARLTQPTSGAPALELLRALGMTTPKMKTVASGDDLPGALTELSGPVVAKTADPRATHKTESGGVRLGLQGLDQVCDAVTSLTAGGAAGVLLQEQVGEGVELLVGVTHEADLGCFVMVGLGGVWTEILDDVSVRPVGLLVGEAERMLRELRGFPLLAGARGTPRVKLEAVVRTIELVDALAVRHGELIESLDINPLIATPAGATAVDCLLVPRARP